jgi:ABC-type Fe3+-hydroxamate transport system substrate-binding protein
MRIVSLVPSQTELLHDLGLEDQIVGITKFCVHPLHYKSTKVSVGGTKQIKIEKIKALKPDIILCNKEENTKDIVEACQEICKVHVSDLYTIQDTLDLITFYGEIFNKQINAKYIIDKIKFLQSDFEHFIKDKQTIKVAYFIWRNPWMVAANNTFIDYMLKLNKFVNIYANLERYPEVDITKINQEGNPEVILLSSEPYPFKDEHAFELNKYSQNAKTIFVDGEMFSWYGTRLLKAFNYFKTLRTRL